MLEKVVRSTAMASHATANAPERTEMAHHIAKNSVVRSSNPHRDSRNESFDEHNYNGSAPSSPSSSAVNNNDASISSWSERISSPIEPLRRINFKLSNVLYGRKSPTKTPESKTTSDRTPQKPPPASSGIQPRRRRSKSPVKKNSMNEKEQFYACRENPCLFEPSVKAAPLADRPGNGVTQDVTGGLFPTPIPIRCSNPQETEKLIKSSFVYTEKLQFSPAAWASLHVSKCDCHKCTHPINSTCAGSDPNCDCHHRARHFSMTCTDKHCIFTQDSTYTVTSPKDDGTIEIASHEDQPLVYECGMMCSCYPNCARSLVLKGPNKNLYLELRWQPGFGWGAHTLQPIFSNKYLFEYVGYVISQDETFSYAGEVRHDYMFDNDLLTVDAGRQGNIARWLNHSCVPNCVVMCSYVGHTFIDVSRLIVVTKRLIYAGEALTIDYGTAWWRAQFKLKKLVCLCKMPHCRYTREKLERMELDEQVQQAAEQQVKQKSKGKSRFRRDDNHSAETADADSDAVDEDYACSSRMFIRRRRANEVAPDSDDEEIISIHSDDADYKSSKPSTNEKSDISLKRRGLYNENGKPVCVYRTTRRRASDENVVKLRHGRTMKRRTIDGLPGRKSNVEKNGIQATTVSPSKKTSKRERLLEIFSSDAENSSPSKRVVGTEPPSAEPLSSELASARKKLALEARKALDKVKRRPLDVDKNAKNVRTRRRSPMQLRERTYRTVDSISMEDGANKNKPLLTKRQKRSAPMSEKPVFTNYVGKSDEENESEGSDYDADDVNAQPNLPPARRQRAAARALKRAAKKRVKLENRLFGSVSPSPSVNGDVAGGSGKQRTTPMTTRVRAAVVAEKEIVVEAATPPFTMTAISRQQTMTSSSGSGVISCRPACSPSEPLMVSGGGSGRRTRLNTRDVFGSLTPSAAGTPYETNEPVFAGEVDAVIQMPPPPPSVPLLKNLLSSAAALNFTALSSSTTFVPDSQLQTKQQAVFGQRAIKFGMSGFSKPREQPRESPVKLPATTFVDAPLNAAACLPNNNSKVAEKQPSTESEVVKKRLSLSAVTSVSTQTVGEKSASPSNNAVPASSTKTATPATPTTVSAAVLPIEAGLPLSIGASLTAEKANIACTASDAVLVPVTLAEPITPLLSVATPSPHGAAKASTAPTALKGAEGSATENVSSSSNIRKSPQPPSAPPVTIDITDSEEEASAADLLRTAAKKPNIAVISTAAAVPVGAGVVAVDTDDDDIVVIDNHESPTTPTNFARKSITNKANPPNITQSAAALVVAVTTTAATSKITTTATKTVSATKTTTTKQVSSALPPASLPPPLPQPSKPQIVELPLLASALQVLAAKCSHNPFRYVNALHAAAFAQVVVRQLFVSSFMPPAALVDPASSANLAPPRIDQNRYKFLLVCGTQVRTGRFDSPQTVQNYVCDELKLQQLDSTVIVLAESIRCHAGAHCRLDQWPDVNMTYTLKCHVCSITHHVACYAGSRKQAGELLTYVKEYWKQPSKLELHLTCVACGEAELAKNGENVRQPLIADDESDAACDNHVEEEDDSVDSSSDVKLIISVKRPVPSSKRRLRRPVAAAATEAVKPTETASVS